MLWYRDLGGSIRCVCFHKVIQVLRCQEPGSWGCEDVRRMVGMWSYQSKGCVPVSLCGHQEGGRHDVQAGTGVPTSSHGNFSGCSPHCFFTRGAVNAADE